MDVKKRNERKNLKKEKVEEVTRQGGRTYVKKA